MTYGVYSFPYRWLNFADGQLFIQKTIKRKNNVRWNIWFDAVFVCFCSLIIHMWAAANLLILYFLQTRVHFFSLFRVFGATFQIKKVLTVSVVTIISTEHTHPLRDQTPTDKWNDKILLCTGFTVTVRRKPEQQWFMPISVFCAEDPSYTILSLFVKIAFYFSKFRFVFSVHTFQEKF